MPHPLFHTQNMEFTLNVTAERLVVRESLKGAYAQWLLFSPLLTAGLIWTIFFHRLFGPITPATSDFFSITYPTAANLPDVDTLIDERIADAIRQYFDRNGPQETPSGRIVVQFFDKRTSKSKKKTGWFGQGKPDDTLDLWELWVLNVACVAEGPLDDHALSVASFKHNLGRIIEIADSHKDHIPPITSLESLPFPYAIDVDKPLEYTTAQDEGWGRYIKRMMD